MKFIAIIPSRYASTRFPGKPLVEIGGKSMVQRVYQQAAKVFGAVVVAVDDERIFNHVQSFGGKVVMTSTEHKSGTDRLAEAVEKIDIDKKDLVVVNIQGDEPFIKPEQMKELKDCFNDATTQIATLVRKIEDHEELFNINIPKVVINSKQEAIYFSRNTIPFLRDYPKEEWLRYNDFFAHIGIYAYRYDVLKQIVELPQSNLEKTECLEQLRWIENGYKVKVNISHFKNIGIDTHKDLERIKNIF